MIRHLKTMLLHQFMILLLLIISGSLSPLCTSSSFSSESYVVTFWSLILTLEIMLNKISNRNAHRKIINFHPTIADSLFAINASQCDFFTVKGNSSAVKLGFINLIKFSEWTPGCDVDNDTICTQLYYWWSSCILLLSLLFYV